MSVPLTGSPSARFNTATRDKLRLIANYQRWVLLALLGGLLFYVVLMLRFSGLVVIPNESLWVVIFRVVNWCLCICMLVSVVLLTRQFYGVAITVLCGLAMFIPFISLLVLLIVNGKATKYLQFHEVKVGLLGANPNSI